MKQKTERLKNGTRVATGLFDRVNLDSLLLASFVRTGSARRILDIGAGCGILLFWLFDRGYRGGATALEIRPEAAALVRASRALNRWGGLEIADGDARDYRGAAPFDLVTANPPYYPADKRKTAGEGGRTDARSERLGSLEVFAGCAARNLAPGGSFYVCYPASAKKRLFSALGEAGLSAARIRFCRHDAGREPWLMLAEAVFRGQAGARPPAVLPDFIAMPDGKPGGEWTEITAGGKEDA